MKTNIKKKLGWRISIFTFGLILMVTLSIAQQQEQNISTDSLNQSNANQSNQSSSNVEYTDDQLKSFLKANAKVVEIQNESEKKMIAAIEEKGLSVERFNELVESQQQGDSTVEATPEEMQALNNAVQMLIEERPKVEQEMIATIEGEGIDVETYQQIMTAYQENPEVQNKINTLLGANKE